MNHSGLVRHSIPLSQHLNKANMETVTTKSVPAVAKRGADRREEGGADSCRDLDKTSIRLLLE